MLGVRPIWQKENRRLVGVEVMPLVEVGRPRIDVTVRISGFFRYAFPHLIQLLDEAVQAVIACDEAGGTKFCSQQVLADWPQRNCQLQIANCQLRSICNLQSEFAIFIAYRIFGSKPGC